MKERIQKSRSNNRLTSGSGIRSLKVTVLFVGQISARPAYNKAHGIGAIFLLLAAAYPMQQYSISHTDEVQRAAPSSCSKGITKQDKAHDKSRGLCVGATYLPGPSPAKYCQQKRA